MLFEESAMRYAPTPSHGRVRQRCRVARRAWRGAALPVAHSARTIWRTRCFAAHGAPRAMIYAAVYLINHADSRRLPDIDVCPPDVTPAMPFRVLRAIS